MNLPRFKCCEISVFPWNPSDGTFCAILVGFRFDKKTLLVLVLYAFYFFSSCFLGLNHARLNGNAWECYVICACDFFRNRKMSGGLLLDIPFSRVILWGRGEVVLALPSK